MNSTAIEARVMKAIAPVLALHHRIVSFAQDRRGVSAVEFAMLLH